MYGEKETFIITNRSKVNVIRNIIITMTIYYQYNACKMENKALINEMQMNHCFHYRNIS